MGAIASCACLDQLPAVAGWLHHAEAARAMNSAHEHASEAARLDALVRHNVIAQLANLRTHPCVARALEHGSAEPARLGFKPSKAAASTPSTATSRRFRHPSPSIPKCAR